MSCNNLSLCWLKSEHVISKVVKFCCLFATIDFTSLRYFSLGINNLPFMIYSISSACLRTHCQQPVYFISVNTVSVCLRTHCQQPVCFISVNTVSVCLRTHCQQPVYFISVNTVSVCLRTHCQQPVYFIFENTVSDFLKFVGPSGQKITRNSNTAKFAGLGVWQNCLFVYFVLHQKSDMQLVWRNDHGHLGIRFCFKWHLLLKHATVFMVILLIIVFL